MTITATSLAGIDPNPQTIEAHRRNWNRLAAWSVGPGAALDGNGGLSANLALIVTTPTELLINGANSVNITGYSITLAITSQVEAPNRFWAGPASGTISLSPTFRAMVPLDIASGGSTGQVATIGAGGTLSWATPSTGSAPYSMTVLGTTGSLSLATANTLTLVGSGITCTLTGTTALPTLTLTAATPTVTSVDTTNGLLVAAGVLKLSATSSEAFGAIVVAGTGSFGGVLTVGGNLIVTGGGTLTTAGAIALATGGNITIPSGATTSQQILGATSHTSATFCTTIGMNAVGSKGSTNIKNVVIGANAGCTSGEGFDGRNVVIGANASCNGAGLSVVIGESAKVSGQFGIALGWNVNVTNNYSIGFNTNPTADSQVAFGIPTATSNKAPSFLFRGTNSAFVNSSTFLINTAWISSTSGSEKSQATFSVYNGTAAQVALTIAVNSTATPDATFAGSLTVSGNLTANGTANALASVATINGTNTLSGTFTLGTVTSMTFVQGVLVAVA